jgi:hypothetical protein
MKAAALVTALACLACWVGSTQARQLRQYVVYIPQQGGFHQLATAVNRACTVTAVTADSMHRSAPSLCTLYLHDIICSWMSGLCETQQHHALPVL